MSIKLKPVEDLPEIRRPVRGQWTRAIQRAQHNYPGQWVQARRYKNKLTACTMAHHLRNRYGDNGHGRVEFLARDGTIFMRAHRPVGRPRKAS